MCSFQYGYCDTFIEILIEKGLLLLGYEKI